MAVRVRTFGRLGCTGGNNPVPLGGHHGNRQALPLMARRRAALPFRRSAMAATIRFMRFAALAKMCWVARCILLVGELVLANSPVDSSCWVLDYWGWSLGFHATGWRPVFEARLMRALSFLRWSGASLLPWSAGGVLLLGGTEFVTSGYRSMLSPWWCSVQRCT